MNDNCICVHLYGNGSRDCRLRAEYIYCDRAGECSAYREGMCVNVTTPFGKHCAIGKVRSVDGGTSRGKKYYELTKQAREEAAYRKLNYPNYWRVIRVGNLAMLNIPYVDLRMDSGYLRVESAIGWNREITVEKDVLTPENLHHILSYKPRDFFGTPVKAYRDREVPGFLHQLRKLFPEQYTALLAEHPEYGEMQPDCIGRYAKLATCNPECAYKDVVGNQFKMESGWLVCDAYRSAFAPFAADTTPLKIKITENMRVEITDNGQVTDETVFL